MSFKKLFLAVSGSTVSRFTRSPNMQKVPGLRPGGEINPFRDASGRASGEKSAKLNMSTSLLL